MLLEILPDETDLIIPLEERGSWDPQTIHTHYFAAHVAEANLGAFIYLRYQPAFPLCQGGVCLFRGLDNLDPLEMDYVDFEITMPWPEIDGGQITTRNGLHIDIVEPGHEMRVRYESRDGRTSVDLCQTAAGPLIARPHNMPGEEIATSQSTSPGGSEQMMHCTGEIVLHGERHAVDCFAGRDRSWRQVRVESIEGPGLPPLAWSPVHFDEGLSFGQLSYEPLDTSPAWRGLYEVDPTARSHIYAWLYANGSPREVISVRRNVLEYHPTLPAAIRQQLTIEDATGASHHFEGEAIAMSPVPAWPNIGLVDSVYRWTNASGDIAHGSYQEVWWGDYAREMKRRRASGAR